MGDYSTAFLMRRFKLFSVKLEKNFKKCIGSIELDSVINEPCYKEIIL